MRVLLLQSNQDDAHQLKFARWLTTIGADVVRAGFSRPDYYRTSSSTTFVSLGSLSHERYAARLPAYAIAMRRLRHLASSVDVVLTFHADLTLLLRASLLLTGHMPPMIREFADVPGISNGPGGTARLARSVERLGLRYTSLLVVTSEAFVRSYLRPTLGYEGEWMELKNWPDVPASSSLPVARSEACADTPLTIGYFGLLRCPASLQLLARLTDEIPERYQVIVRGYNLTDLDLKAMADRVPGFRYGGEFASPGDLPEIYAACDIVYSAYPCDPTSINMRLARTNRYFEALVFGRPQINHVGTVDGEAIRAQGNGLLIDLASADESLKALADAGLSEWQAYRRSAQRLAEGAPSFESEAVKLADRLRQLASRPRLS